MLHDFFVGLINLIILAIGTALNALVSIFPPSPFTFVADSRFSDFIAEINFFVPIYEFVSILEAWLVAVGVYYAYSIIARWLKAIE